MIILDFSEFLALNLRVSLRNGNFPSTWYGTIKSQSQRSLLAGKAKLRLIPDQSGGCGGLDLFERPLPVEYIYEVEVK